MSTSGRLTRFGVALCGLLIVATAGAKNDSRPAFDHVFVVVLENRSFDDALFGPTPFIRELARTQGLATWYFGVAHPSLPNYLAMIAGDDFDIRDNAPSCLASGLAKDAPCHAPVHETLADQLEARGLTWAFYGGGLPEPGSLVVEAPHGPAGALYAQKHNPFAYFRQIVGNSARRARIKPLDALAPDLTTAPPNFALIVPDQCEDGHGLAACPDQTDLAGRSDAALRRIVTMIRGAKHWSDRSAIFVTFDEGLPPQGLAGAPRHMGCCSDASGGHHIATIVVSKCGGPRRSAAELDHYSLLATIEDGFGLPRLGKAASAVTMADLAGRECP
ncbi:MAG: hypothetical protein KDJ30_18085 [Rhodoblastus sp.]|nr:hypothetical protein [Rhodoblastus sp.]